MILSKRKITPRESMDLIFSLNESLLDVGNCIQNTEVAMVITPIGRLM
jgi:hypothetical protein